jgi:hypothetical protein
MSRDCSAGNSVRTVDKSDGRYMKRNYIIVLRGTADTENVTRWGGAIKICNLLTMQAGQ